MFPLHASLALAQVEAHLSSKPLGIDITVGLIADHPKTVLAGAGKSFLVAQLVAKIANSYGLKWASLDTSSAGHGDAGMLAKTDLIILISCSGETPETNRFAASLHELTLVSLTTCADSQLARLCLHAMVCPMEGGEGSVYGHAPMCSSIVFLAALFEIINRIASESCSEEKYLSTHPGGAIGRSIW